MLLAAVYIYAPEALCLSKTLTCILKDNFFFMIYER